MARLLLADDQPGLRRAIRQFLISQGHHVRPSGSIEELRLAAATGDYDAILLDRGFPEGDGLDVCRELRARHDDTPVLIITARDAAEDIVEGLRAGADDYVVKPLRLPVLEAKIGAILRRRPPPLRLEVGPFILRPPLPWVLVDGVRVDLTPREAKLLTVLARHEGETSSRDELLRCLWDDPLAVSDNALDAVVSRLRRRLRPYHALLETDRGRGFRLRADRANANPFLG